MWNKIKNLAKQAFAFITTISATVIWTLGILTSIVILWYIEPMAAQAVLGVILGILLTFTVFGLLTPLFIEQLVNRPSKDAKSGFHLFTYPEEGKVKIVVRGDRVVRMIMLYAGHKFSRKRNYDESGHWQIVKGESENPLTGISPFFLPWAWYVYHYTGAVFTGIYPWQTVREYDLERTKMDRDESIKGSSENIVLSVEKDISDHYRARQFLYPFRVPSADTKDRISVNILAVIRARVVNPHKAAFGTDRWDHQMVNLATNAVTNFTRSNNLDQVLSAKDPADAERLNKAVEEILADEKKYGIAIDGIDLIDISPNLSEVDRAKLHAEALAKSTSAATLLDMEQRAKGLRSLNEANQAGGEFAIETQRTEGMVRAAEAAKGGTVLMYPGGRSAEDPTQVAILAELKKLNRKEENQ